MGVLLKKQNILIVDDSSVNTAFLSNILKDEYQIRTVKNGKDAFEIAFSHNPPDLIILDVIMPDIDGYEVCKKLKSVDTTKDIPIIFITGRIKEDDEIYGFSLGAVDYISKPYNAIIVKARVKTHMELKLYRDYLESLSYLDGLTGIPNKRRFNEKFEFIWEVAQEEKSKIAIIMIDIDNFKAFNDIYGHQAGDDCIIQVAQQLSKTVISKLDFVGRYGGEEFICILPDTDLNNAILLAEKMRQEIMSLNIKHQGSSVSDVVTVSIGLAICIPYKDMNSSILIKLADEALYLAKDTGRNKISVNSKFLDSFTL